MWLETAVPEAFACGLKRPYPVGEYAIYRSSLKTAVPGAAACGVKRP